MPGGPDSSSVFPGVNRDSEMIQWDSNIAAVPEPWRLRCRKEKFRNIKQTWSHFTEERVIQCRPVDIWVEARTGNSSCTSPRRSVVLRNTVKYAAPQNISMSWLKNSLSLRWRAEEKHPALAEIQFRQNDDPAESWEKRTTNTTSDTFTYYAIVVNLLKDSAYKVQIRQRSTQARNPLWSDWSDVIVPAELEQKPEVTMATMLLNGTRKVTLTWKPMPHAAAVSGVNYSLTDTQSPHGCHFCDETLLNKTLNRKTCLELYELQDGDSVPKYVITLTGRKKKKGAEQIRRTPRRAPQDLISFSETHTSVTLSWKAIPFADQQGYLTRYVLCSVKISSQDVWKECFNISTSLVTYRLENLSPGAKYNISLVGVTQVGEGPEATVTINTLPERPFNSVLTLRIKSKILPPVPTPFIPDFIPYQPESQCDLQQELLERKEEVHELTLHQLSPEGKSVPEDAEETDVFTGEWDNGVDEDMENKRGDSRMSGGSSDQSLDPSSTDEALRSSREGEMMDLEQVDNEIAMLIYRNGLVFDVKMDSP
ncbi:hypothetical protein FQN60_012826 [Etheostoma spectabile]|uniref:Fibronectin type-III domain-containing protein n=1 Tax=Etheostoma spectabile TaxID=54343 RepID=A0A5J5DC61_9PERO|nr:hypothetical protein FQN60_012826 [Etheostoma spectabile]